MPLLSPTPASPWSWQAENWRREEGGFLFKQEEVRRSLGWAQMGLVKMAARSWEEK